MSELRPGQGADAFNIRLPPGMRDRIKAAADAHGRSMNAEIVTTLEAHYPAVSLDVRAVDSLLHYVSNAATDQERIERVQEVNAKFTAMGSLLQVEIRPDGKVSIITEF